MLDFSVLINSADPRFKIKAFNEYCQDKQASYELVMALLTDVISDETLTPAASATTSNIQYEDSDPLKLKIESYDLNPESQILLQSGYIKLYDLAYHILSISGEEEDSDVNFYEPLFPIHNAKNVVVDVLSYSEVAQELSSSLHSMTALIAANKAVEAGSVADALTVFRDEIQTKFANSYADVSNTAATLKCILEDTRGNTAAYFQNLSSAMGIEQLAEDESETVPNTDDFAKFSGASPSACLCSGISGAAKPVAAVVNTAAKVVGGILKGIFSIGKSLFTKAKNWIHQTLVDPKDLKYSDDGESYTIDGFSFDSDEVVRVGLPENSTASQIQALVTPYLGAWLGFDTYYSSVLIRINESYIDDQDRLYFKVSGKIKPKTVSPIVLQKLINASGEDSGPLSLITSQYGLRRYSVNNAQAVYDLASQYAAYGPDPLNDSSDEQALLEGLLAGLAMTNVITSAAIKKNNLYIPYADSIIAVGDMSAFKSYLGGQIRNCDFITAASGYYWSGTSSNWKPGRYIRFSGSSPSDLLNNASWSSSIIQGFAQLFAAHVYEKNMYPLDFAFFPYTNDSWNFPSSKWTVSTDADNDGAFDKFVAVATIAIITIAVATTAAVIIKKLKNKMTLKALQRKSVLDQKMWNGEKLTSKEWKQYKRANKRVNASSILNKGLQETGSDTSSATVLNGDDSTIVLSDISQSITG